MAGSQPDKQLYHEQTHRHFSLSRTLEINTLLYTIIPTHTYSNGNTVGALLIDSKDTQLGTSVPANDTCGLHRYISQIWTIYKLMPAGS